MFESPQGHRCSGAPVVLPIQTSQTEMTRTGEAARPTVEDHTEDFLEWSKSHSRQLSFAALALLTFMYVVIYGKLRPGSNIVEWVDWQDAYLAVGGIAVLGFLLTLFPTLVMTRKYLKV